MKYTNILIPVDGSECSKNAAAKGLDLAKQLSAKVMLLSVVDLTGAISSTAVSGTVNTDMIKIYHEDAERIVNEIADKNPTADISKLTVEGDPQQEILYVAKDRKAEMIIMGTHGRTGLKHLFMGSVAESVVRHAEVPVLIIPEGKKS